MSPATTEELPRTELRNASASGRRQLEKRRSDDLKIDWTVKY